MTEQRVDVAVVGGGMVGAALAVALAKHDFSVVVVESRVPPLAWDDGYDLRVSAVTRASQHLLDNLGVWSVIVADRATPYRHMHVWDRPGLGEIHFGAADLGEPDLGHIVENRVIVRALWRAFEVAGVQVRAPEGLRRLQADAAGAVIQLDDQSRIRADLVVGADGARSKVRDLAGIASRGEAYDQHAVVASVQAEHGNRSTAWQRFMPDGPLALLPLGDRHFSIVWSTRPDEAERLVGLPADAFDALLTEASEARLGALTLQGGRGAFPLRLQHAERYILPGLALVGDAAHVIHPLAGQGVNLGFLDAAALLDAVTDGRAAGRRPGAVRVLRAYERARRGHNTATQLAMDGFKHLFGNDHAGLAVLRNLGLGTAGRIPPLRRLFERVALGQGVELPRLSRPVPPATTG